MILYRALVGNSPYIDLRCTLLRGDLCCTLLRGRHGHPRLTRCSAVNNETLACSSRRTGRNLLIYWQSLYKGRCFWPPLMNYRINDPSASDHQHENFSTDIQSGSDPLAGHTKTSALLHLGLPAAWVTDPRTRPRSIGAATPGAALPASTSSTASAGAPS